MWKDSLDVNEDGIWLLSEAENYINEILKQIKASEQGVLQRDAVTFCKSIEYPTHFNRHF